MTNTYITKPRMTSPCAVSGKVMRGRFHRVVRVCGIHWAADSLPFINPWTSGHVRILATYVSMIDPGPVTTIPDSTEPRVRHAKTRCQDVPLRAGVWSVPR